RPGEDVVAEAGGLHSFMQWPKAMTTDSGGYQVFSLSENVKFTDDAVTFTSPRDGQKHVISPEKAIEIETKLGADLIMPLDVCTPFGAPHDEVAAAVEQTQRWAKRCKDEFEKAASAKGFGEPTQALYGIVQGSTYPDLRQQSAEGLRELDLFGYAIGGELREKDEKEIVAGVAMTTQHLPADKPRYLMGSGTPGDIVAAVRLGVDQFDCVLPIRNARHGQLFFDLNRDEVTRLLHDPERPVVEDELYRTVDIRKADYARDFSVFSPSHPVIEKPYTVSYVHHLMRAEAPSGFRLCVLHNIYFYVQLMHAIREVIASTAVVHS
ncbi:MAG TPA: tRNA guanosine(34) transglycosylase Tgt, partial [Bryobacteraceae bacterium]|nr:tRNA guanosine(34) transglycosylase Tgt [Bryobacteraceae bacterium]